MKYVSVVFFWVTTSSTHYQFAILLTKWRLVGWLCIYPQKNGYLSMCLEISTLYGNGLTLLGSLVMCTVYTNTFTFG